MVTELHCRNSLFRSRLLLPLRHPDPHTFCWEPQAIKHTHLSLPKCLKMTAIDSLLPVQKTHTLTWLLNPYQNCAEHHAKFYGVFGNSLSSHSEFNACLLSCSWTLTFDLQADVLMDLSWFLVFVKLPCRFGICKANSSNRLIWVNNCHIWNLSTEISEIRVHGNISNIILMVSPIFLKALDCCLRHRRVFLLLS